MELIYSEDSRHHSSLLFLSFFFLVRDSSLSHQEVVVITWHVLVVWGVLVVCGWVHLWSHLLDGT